MKSKFYNQPITENNFYLYLDEEYGIDNITLGVDVEIDKSVGFLQKDYGEENDCTLTSIATMFQNIVSSSFETMDATYKKILELALSSHSYSSKSGTNPFRVDDIICSYIRTMPQWWYLYNSVMSKAPPRVASRYLKNIFYGFRTIKNSIDIGYPVVLSFHKDGRQYYKDHTVLIFGYSVHRMENQKPIYFLKVFDNWSKQTRYIDYQKLGIIASIVYLTER